MTLTIDDDTKAAALISLLRDLAYVHITLGNQAAKTPTVEAFVNEDEALDFANRVSLRTAHEAR
jgi:hypothetical protein